MISDNPSKIDQFGFQPMASILCNVIRDLREPPFTIGIFGEWGCGKTSLMQQVQDLLKKEDVKTVWFNAWKYDRKEVIWNALLQQIFYEIKEDIKKQERKDREKLIEQIKEIASKLTLYAAKVGTRLIPGNLVKEDDVDTIAKAFAPLSAEDEEFDFINKFESIFNSLVDEYLGGKDKYLVVFIDDLDRCLPENAIEVMEAIKLYLDRSNCIFVIGTESSIIEEGIRQRYKDNVRLSAKEYLEKIIQLPFVMRSIDIENSLPNILEPYNDILNYRDRVMHNLIVEGTKSNPRRIKRFANTFWVLAKIDVYSNNGQGEMLDDFKQQHLAKILLIQMRFPKFYYALVENQKLVGDIVEASKASTEDDRNRILDRAKELRDFYKDVELKRFLEKTQDIPCHYRDIHPWIILTKGQFIE